MREGSVLGGGVSRLRPDCGNKVYSDVLYRGFYYAATELQDAAADLPECFAPKSETLDLKP